MIGLKSAVGPLGKGSVAVLAFCGAVMASESAFAWPDQPITLIVPYAAGGGSDAIARILAEAMSNVLGQPILLEHRTGANGRIGLTAAAHAAPDGYTLVVGHVGTHALNPGLYGADTGYDTLADFVTVGISATSSNVVVVHPSVGAANMEEFVEIARETPGGLSYGSTGVGGPSHMSIELFAQMNDLEFLHVPYPGGAPAVMDLLGGTIDFMFSGTAESLPHAEVGRVNALAVTGSQRLAAEPDLPTIAESGWPDYAFDVWHVMSVQAEVPEPILEQLREAMQTALADETVQQRLADVGMELPTMGPEEADAHVTNEVERWTQFIVESEIRGN